MTSPQAEMSSPVAAAVLDAYKKGGTTEVELRFPKNHDPSINLAKLVVANFFTQESLAKNISRTVNIIVDDLKDNTQVVQIVYNDAMEIISRSITTKTELRSDAVPCLTNRALLAGMDQNYRKSHEYTNAKLAISRETIVTKNDREVKEFYATFGKQTKGAITIRAKWRCSQDINIANNTFAVDVTLSDTRDISDKFNTSVYYDVIKSAKDWISRDNFAKAVAGFRSLAQSQNLEIELELRELKDPTQFESPKHIIEKFVEYIVSTKHGGGADDITAGTARIFEQLIKVAAENVLRPKRTRGPPSSLKEILQNAEALHIDTYCNLWQTDFGTVSIKNDGTRALLMSFVGGHTFIVTESKEIVGYDTIAKDFVAGTFVPEIELAQSRLIAIAEGELLPNEEKSFVPYDLHYFLGIDHSTLRDMPYYARVKYLEQCLAALLPTANIAFKQILPISRDNIENLWQQSTKIANDGLVFTFAENILKWKPAHHNTVDLVCKKIDMKYIVDSSVAASLFKTFRKSFATETKTNFADCVQNYTAAYILFCTASYATARAKGLINDSWIDLIKMHFPQIVKEFVSKDSNYTHAKRRYSEAMQHAKGKQSSSETQIQDARQAYLSKRRDLYSFRIPVLASISQLFPTYVLLIPMQDPDPNYDGKTVEFSFGCSPNGLIVGGKITCEHGKFFVPTRVREDRDMTVMQNYYGNNISVVENTHLAYKQNIQIADLAHPEASIEKYYFSNYNAKQSEMRKYMGFAKKQIMTYFTKFVGHAVFKDARSKSLDVVIIDLGCGHGQEISRHAALNDTREYAHPAIFVQNVIMIDQDVVALKTLYKRYDEMIHRTQSGRDTIQVQIEHLDLSQPFDMIASRISDLATNARAYYTAKNGRVPNIWIFSNLAIHYFFYNKTSEFAQHLNTKVFANPGDAYLFTGFDPDYVTQTLDKSNGLFVMHNSDYKTGVECELRRTNQSDVVEVKLPFSGNKFIPEHLFNYNQFTKSIATSSQKTVTHKMSFGDFATDYSKESWGTFDRKLTSEEKQWCSMYAAHMGVVKK